MKQMTSSVFLSALPFYSAQLFSHDFEDTRWLGQTQVSSVSRSCPVRSVRIRACTLSDLSSWADYSWLAAPPFFPPSKGGQAR